MKDVEPVDDLDGIAIIGMAGRFPGAGDVDRFWLNLRDGVESIARFSDQDLIGAGVAAALLADPNYVKAGAVLEGVELFDAQFFGYSPREAEIIDPQQRCFLECCWEALETAGYAPETYRGQIGVYAGISDNDYFIKNLRPRPELGISALSLSMTVGNEKDYLATRVSYKLNLKGPSITIQTACSTSLVAVHLASQALLNGECDMALAGGVSFKIPQKAGYLYQEGSIYSPDGHCRAFDAQANGTVFGSGLGIVVLKRLADALRDNDCIQAVIKGSAINNDGSLKIGYTAPSVEGQAQVIAEAMANAGVHPKTITYIETHGTGTPLGDPIEIAALTKAFRAKTGAKGGCAIGSVKSSVGHLNVAAGIASLIKTVLALRHRQLPASLHFVSPNPKIELENSPFFVNAALRDWQTDGLPRRAGVSSFGVGGTNAHVVLEEAPEEEPSGHSARPQVLLLSAKTQQALDKATSRLAEHLDLHPEINLADAAFTLAIGRSAMDFRRMVVCRNVGEAVQSLTASDPKRVFTSTQPAEDRPVVFMFSGQGSQYIHMTHELYQLESGFRRQVDRCAELLRPCLGLDLRAVMYPEKESAEAAARQLDQTGITQPALFVVEYALAMLLRDWGITPQAMIGHSLGEYVAACLSGVFSLEDALALVAERGRLMNQLTAGSMLSVPLAAKDVAPFLGSELSLAVVNGPALSVISGPTSAVDRLEKVLSERNIEGRRVRTSHAFHSQMVDPILATFSETVRKAGLRPPQIPYISNFTGTWITSEQATDPAYWAKHLRHTVHFSAGLHELMKKQDRILLEVGPGQTLCSFARRQAHGIGEFLILPSLSRQSGLGSEVDSLLQTLGRLWLAGAHVDWPKYYAQERRRRLSLPTYPFDRQRYWLDAPKGAGNFTDVGQAPASLPAGRGLDDWFYLPWWKPSPPPAHKGLQGREQRKFCWLLFLDSEGNGEQLAHRLEQQGQEVITVVPGDHFERLSERAYVIEAGQQRDYKALFEALRSAGKTIDRMVHMWLVSSDDPARSELDRCEEILGMGFYSMLYTMQAIGSLGLGNPMKLWTISSGIFDVTGYETLHPVKATVLGLCKTIPLEYANVFCQCIDTDSLGRATDRLVEAFFDESAEPVVAIRGQHRWVQFLEPIRIGPASQGPTRFRERGVYLITGGVGGIGLVLAEYLARTARARLVLLDRVAIPGREDWQSWVRTHGEEDAVSRKIRRMESLETLGSEVLYINADVTSLEQIKDAVARAHARFGAIHGVIHTAGLAGGGIIQLKSPESAGAVLAPKVKGTLVLDEALKGTPPELFVLFSSTYGVRSRLGQVDYCGANAFLDAFSHYKHLQGGKGTVSINWDGWQEVGMAADAARARQGSAVPRAPQSSPADHPLLDSCIMDTGEVLAYRTSLRVGKHWPLNEHRLAGKAVLPGTACLEMVRAIYEKHFHRQRIEISDVFFISPLIVEEEEPKEAITFLTREGDRFDFRILSKAKSGSGESSGWLEHARGKVGALSSAAPARRNVADIIARCGRSLGREEIAGQGERHANLVFWGPRWQSLTQAWLGADEAIARLDLPEPFAADLQDWKLHPSLLDVATSLAVRSTDGDIYLPLSYERLLLRNPFLPLLYCHTTLENAPSARRETLTADVMILDENGEVVAEVEKVTFKKMREDAAVSGLTKGGAGSAAKGALAKIVAELQRHEASVPGMAVAAEVTAGIKPAEGLEALQRVLSLETPQIVVSVGDIRMTPEREPEAPTAAPDQERHEPEESPGRHARPNVRSSYIAPRDDRERTLAGIWQEALGIDQVGIHDNFFELGGDSVIAIQIIAKANKSGFHLAANQMFEHPTISEIMDAAAGPAESDGAPGSPPQPSEAADAASADSFEFSWTQEELSKIAGQLNKSRGDA